MPDSHRNTTFYVEALILTCVFTAVLLISVRVFSTAHRESTEATALSDAVSLAKNTAEAVSASASEEDLFTLLNENGNAEERNDTVTAWYGKSLLPGREGACYCVSVSWDTEKTGGGRLAESRITVYPTASETALYSLDTAVYLPAAEGGTA